MKFIITCFLIVLSTFAFGQKNKGDIKQADKHFARFEYYLAAEEYLKVVEEEPDNVYAIHRLAQSFYNFFNYKKAEQYYSKLLAQDKDTYPEALYFYALTQKLNGKYEEALESFQEFLDSHADITDKKSELYYYKEKAKKDIEGCKMAINEMKKPVRNYSFELVPSPVNTTSSEFSPAIMEHDTAITIASSRSESTGGEQFGMLGGTFSDAYRFDKFEVGWNEKGVDDKFDDINTKYNESPGSFTENKNKFYFTKCDEEVKVGHYVDFNCAIYVSKFKDGKWTEPEKLNENVNMKGEWNSQPSVSPNGDTLFFTSKRPGGFGLHDIWFTTCSGDDNWGPAVNLGYEVNTPFMDMSPFYYSNEGKLFFATNGRTGFGGLDIFSTTEKGFKKADNMGLPFNSSKDDFFFILGEKKGYLSSNRDGGLGNEDIYMFEIIASETVIAHIKEDSLKEMARARQTVEPLSGQFLDENNDGIHDPDEIKSFGVKGTMKVDETGEPAANVTILLTDDEGNTLKKVQTNDDGLFRIDNIAADQDYKVLLEEANPKLTSEVEYIVDPKVEVNGSKLPSTRTLFENIYFDFDKYYLRPEAKKTLDDLVKFYKQNPGIQIEMSANTDAIGSDEYNQVLAKKRGVAALTYLKASGVDQSALVVNAMGEKNPIAGNANPVGRQLNRRVEFHIVGGEGAKGYDAGTMTYIVQPKTTLYEVAEKYNMSIDEIKELNALEDENLMAYRPLRVRRIGDSDIIDPVSLSIGKEDKRNKKFYKNEFKKAEAYNKTYKRLVDEGKINPNLTYVPEKMIMKLNPGESYYIAQPKNTLFRISKLYGTKVSKLKEINGLDSDTIYIGQIIKVVTGTRAPTASEYVVQKGDTFASVAKKHGLTVAELKAMNMMEGYLLREKMILQVE